MLYLYQRTMFGKIENPKNERLMDLSHREFATFAPLLVLAVWMGLYPAPFLRRLETSVAHIIARVDKDKQYAQAYATAADCGGGTLSPPAAVAAAAAPAPTSAGPAANAATPPAEPAPAAAATSAFLVAAPCGPDGKPLTGAPR
jgi:NADH-quinone oxidoreductase subunit M